MKSKMKLSFGERLFNIFNFCLMLLIIIITLYPMIYVVAVSLSSAEYVQANLVRLIPKGFTTSAYLEVFRNEFFWTSYRNTVVYTVVGTLINMSLTSMLAFVLSRKELLFRKGITLLVVFTMFFKSSLQSCVKVSSTMFTPSIA